LVFHVRSFLKQLFVIGTIAVFWTIAIAPLIRPRLLLIRSIDNAIAIYKKVVLLLKNLRKLSTGFFCPEKADMFICI